MHKSCYSLITGLFLLLLLPRLSFAGSNSDSNAIQNIIREVKRGSISGEAGIYLEIIDFDKDSYVEDDEIIELDSNDLMVPYVQVNYTSPLYAGFSVGGGITGYAHLNVSNLIENAIKYTPEGGTVTIAVQTKHGNVEIDVEGTGMGISETKTPHIFARIYRCDTSRPNHGIGLGLSLAKALTEALYGTVSAKSTLNRGSRFTVRFPDRFTNS